MSKKALRFGLVGRESIIMWEHGDPWSTIIHVLLCRRLAIEMINTHLWALPGNKDARSPRQNIFFFLHFVWQNLKDDNVAYFWLRGLTFEAFNTRPDKRFSIFNKHPFQIQRSFEGKKTEQWLVSEGSTPLPNLLVKAPRFVSANVNNLAWRLVYGKFLKHYRPHSIKFRCPNIAAVATILNPVSSKISVF